MMKDIGLHLRTGRLASLVKLDPEDLEVRKRLFLSAYAWDKYGHLIASSAGPR
jgi:hypothetical protein